MYRKESGLQRAAFVVFHSFMYEYETNMGINALTGGLTWCRGPCAKVSR